MLWKMGDFLCRVYAAHAAIDDGRHLGKPWNRRRVKNSALTLGGAFGEEVKQSSVFSTAGSPDDSPVGAQLMPRPLAGEAPPVGLQRHRPLIPHPSCSLRSACVSHIQQYTNIQSAGLQLRITLCAPVSKRISSRPGVITITHECHHPRCPCSNAAKVRN
jgi:hypothetical protein